VEEKAEQAQQKISAKFAKKAARNEKISKFGEAKSVKTANGNSKKRKVFDREMTVKRQK
jgi:hypothetical protein